MSLFIGVLVLDLPQSEIPIVRSIIILIAFTNVLFLSACSSIGARQPELLTQHPSDCPELEGYPDCQDGHHVEFPDSQLVTPQLAAAK